MNVYLYPSNTETELKNAYIGEYKEWTPWANTLAYFPLEWDYKDYSWNWNNGTKSWTINFVTSWGLTYAETSSYTAWYVSFPITMNSTAYTLSWWVNLQLPSQYYRWWSIFWIWNTTNSLCGTDVWWWYNKFDVTVVGTRDWISNVAPSASTWYHIAWIFTTTWMKMYVNWAQAYSDSNSYTLSWSSWKLFSRDALTSWDYHWALSQIIIENKEWTQQEVSDYYNLTKSNYWL